jgi:hypothetical protein
MQKSRKQQHDANSSKHIPLRTLSRWIAGSCASTISCCWTKNGKIQNYDHVLSIIPCLLSGGEKDINQSLEHWIAAANNFERSTQKRSRCRINMSESWNDVSESSSVRMERELLETSADNLADNDSNAVVVPDNNDSTTTHHSLTLELFDSEILRMSRDADQILDSIRQEVAQSSPSHSISRNSSTVRFISTTTTTFQMADQTSEDRLNSVTPIPSGGFDDRAILSLCPAAAGADDEDDDMMDEVERLDAVSEVIRQSLSVDAADDITPTITATTVVNTSTDTRSTDAKKPSKHPNTSSNEDRKEKLLVVDNRAAMHHSQQNTTSSSLPTVTSAASHPAAVKNATANGKVAIVHDRKGFSAPTATTTKDAELKSSSSNKSLLEQTNVKVQAMADRYESHLLLMVTLVWALVLLLLVHARYQLLDANGVIQLPMLGH